jgi:hypothetical protein
MKNIVICCCVKDCESYIDNVFLNIKKIANYCNILKVVISYDLSKDKTLLKLCHHKNTYNIDIIFNKKPLHNNRVINITNARNRYMDHMNNLKHL